MQDQSTSSVYFIQSGDNGPIKIGVAIDVAERLAGLQTASPEPLKLLGYATGHFREEKFLHGLLAEHRVSGEWFSPTTDVMSAIKAFLMTDNFSGAAKPAAKPVTKRKRLFLDLPDDWNLWRGAKQPLADDMQVGVYNKDLQYAWGPAHFYDWEWVGRDESHIVAYCKTGKRDEGKLPNVLFGNRPYWNTIFLRQF